MCGDETKALTPMRLHTFFCFSKMLLMMKCLNFSLLFIRTSIYCYLCAIVDTHSTLLRGDGHQNQYNVSAFYLPAFLEDYPLIAQCKSWLQIQASRLFMKNTNITVIDWIFTKHIQSTVSEQLTTSVGIFAKSPLHHKLSNRNMFCISVSIPDKYVLVDSGEN